MNDRRVECFFDCSSPWTYLAFHRLRGLAVTESLDVAWRPILVGGIFNSVNPAVYESRTNPVPAKAAYLAKDLADWAQFVELDILWPPSVFPVNSAAAMRGCLFALGRGRLEAFADGVFRAYWSEDMDISDRAVLAGIAEDSGLAPEPFLAAVDSDALRAQLRANTEECIARGGFGSPTLFLGDDMYFGNDRLELLVAAVNRRA